MDPHTQIPLLRGLHDSPLGLALFDAEDRLRYANTWFAQAYGIDEGSAPTWEQIMRDCHRHRRGVLIETPDINAWIAQVRSKYRQQPQRGFESDLVDGRWLWVTESLQPDGWLTTTCTEITGLKAHEATLRKARDEAVIASLTDPLTELYNRRYIFKRLDDLLASARSMRYPLCLALMDLDNFKALNDAHGHGAGDRVLRRFARHLKQQLRPLDSVGRIGGEEFMLVLPNATVAGAQAALARLRDTLDAPSADTAQQALDPHLPLPRCTFSAGLTLARVGDDAERIFARADRALYRAKAAGRDQQVVDEECGA
jgi:diguanylate cyclase (GGDEF)-like protein